MTNHLPIYYLVKPDELTSLIKEQDEKARRLLAVGIIASWGSRAPETWRRM